MGIVEYFIGANVFSQLLITMIAGMIVVVFFGFLFKSHKKSLNLLIDPGSVADIEGKRHIFLGIIEILFGIIIVGTIASLITNQIIETSEEIRIKKIHAILKESFETNSLIKTRKLLNENHIEARRRMFNLTEAEVRLEIGKEDLVKAIRQNGKSRLRMLKTDDQVYIEDFETNTEYGNCKDRNSSLTIISTQNYSDAGVGHFASTLAKNLNANYISNEFFSSGAPLKSRHINFANNNEFINLGKKHPEKSPLISFMNDIDKINKKTKLYIYIGTSNSENNYDLYCLFGGDKNNDFNVAKSTYSDLQTLQAAFNQLNKDFSVLDLKCATHKEDGDIKKNHLSLQLHNVYKKNVINLQVSTKILWIDDEQTYYKSLIAILNAIKQLEKNNSTRM